MITKKKSMSLQEEVCKPRIKSEAYDIGYDDGYDLGSLEGEAEARDEILTYLVLGCEPTELMHRLRFGDEAIAAKKRDVIDCLQQIIAVKDGEELVPLGVGTMRDIYDYIHRMGFNAYNCDKEVYRKLLWKVRGEDIAL